MISIDALAAELATKYDIDRTAARTAVETYAGQLNDDDTLYDETSGELTKAGAELVRDQFAADYAGQPAPGSVGATHLELREEIKKSVALANDLAQRRDGEIARRDDLVRAAIKGGVRVEDIAQDVGLKRARIYQIRDGRR